MSTMLKYPVTVYNPNVVALSTADYFNIPKLYDLLVSFSSSRLYSVVPEMHELDKGRYTFRPNETGYVKNPTAQNITNYINNTNYLGTGGKKEPWMDNICMLWILMIIL